MPTIDPIAHKPPFPQNYADEFLVLDHGKGTEVWDRAGKRYLDFTGGIAVNALGHGRRDLAQIARKQMEKLTHVSNLYTTEPALLLAARLVATGNPGQFAAVHFGNSGTEANEAALKYARVYALRTKGEGHHKFASFTGAFHGRTLGSLSLTPTEKYQKPYHPLIPGCETLPYNDVKALAKLDRSFAAVLIEPIQGEGGLDSVSPRFAQALQKVCLDNDILIIADEIQGGYGRTGTFYAWQQLGLTPDIVTLAKPMAGGLPLSATLIPARVNAVVHVGDHGTTFGGGPVTTAVANRVFEVIGEPKFLENVARRGKSFERLLKGLKNDFPFAREVKGMGLLRGLRLDYDSTKKGLLGEVIAACQAQGLLLLRAGTNVLRFAPPLTVSRKELEEAVGILRIVLAAKAKEFS
ncbi:MAG: aspartate aminotransferase family protein [Spirochaetales bacterium]